MLQYQLCAWKYVWFTKNKKYKKLEMPVLKHSKNQMQTKRQFWEGRSLLINIHLGKSWKRSICFWRPLVLRDNQDIGRQSTKQHAMQEGGGDFYIKERLILRLLLQLEF